MQIYKGHELNEFEVRFLETFESTHSLKEAYATLNEEEVFLVKERLRNKLTILRRAFDEFIKSNPENPNINRVVLLEKLSWMLEKAQEAEDTITMLNVIKEIAKLESMYKAPKRDATRVERIIAVETYDLTEPKTLNP